MLQYICVKEAGIALAHEAFAAAFEDYMIPMSMSRGQFEERMFTKERHLANQSYVAMDGEYPVGILLSACREYGGQLSMRCGALGIAPSYRGRGVAGRLVELHQKAALQSGCTQLVLEVISGNERAERFYLRHGYSPVGRLAYFRCSEVQDLASRLSACTHDEVGRDKRSSKGCQAEKLEIVSLEQAALSGLAREWGPYPQDWQSSNEYLYPNGELMVWGCRLNGQLIGAIAMNQSGKMCFLLVEEKHRRMGAATALLQTAAAHSKASQLTVTTTGNQEAQEFLLSCGFDKLPLEQLLMIAPL